MIGIEQQEKDEKMTFDEAIESMRSAYITRLQTIDSYIISL